MKNKHLPVFGVGPVYVPVIVIITFAGIYLTSAGYIPFIGIKGFKYIFLFFGVFFTVLGIFLWIKAIVFSKMENAVKNNRLLKTGVYAYVRNPVYSAFMFICTGVILIYSDIVLMFLPFLYWIFMTVLLKHTEEKWLLDLYGQEYAVYCQKVNRCIPWF